MPSFKDIFGKVAEVAPTIATALVGPAGGAAVSLVTHALGLGTNASESDVVAAIQNATPEQMLALKKADLDYKLAIAQAEYADTASARNMAVQNRDNTPKILTYMILAVFVGLYGYARFVTDPHQLDLLKDGVNTMRDAVIMVVSFYFGSMHRPSK